MKQQIDHILVPNHTKLSDNEKEDFFKKHNLTFNELSKISKKDAAISHLDPKEGDVIKIIRKSPTANESVFYRGIVNV